MPALVEGEMRLAENGPTGPKGVPNGIGGWLVIPLLILAYWLIISWYVVIALVVQFHAAVFTNSGAQFRLLVSAIELVIVSYCAVRILQKHWHARLLMPAFFAFNIIYLLAQKVWPVLLAEPIRPLHFVVSSTVSVVWLIYFIHSKRVKNTFVRAKAVSRCPSKRGGGGSISLRNEETMALNWEAKDELRGIRGWLVLPLIHLGLTLLWSAWLIAGTMPQPLAWVLLVFTLFGVFCAVRFLQERHEVPRLMIVFCALCIVLATTSLIGGLSMLMIAQFLLGVALIVYFLESERVANTFVR
jgi:hypothetical protein